MTDRSTEVWGRVILLVAALAAAVALFALRDPSATEAAKVLVYGSVGAIIPLEALARRVVNGRGGPSHGGGGGGAPPA